MNKRGEVMLYLILFSVSLGVAVVSSYMYFKTQEERKVIQRPAEEAQEQKVYNQVQESTFSTIVSDHSILKVQVEELKEKLSKVEYLLQNQKTFPGTIELVDKRPRIVKLPSPPPLDPPFKVGEQKATVTDPKIIKKLKKQMKAVE